MDKGQLIDDIFDVIQQNDEMCTQEGFLETYSSLYFEVERSNNRIRIQDKESDYFLILSDTPYPTSKEVQHDDFRKMIALMRQNGADDKLIRKVNQYLYKPTQQLKLEF